LGTNSSVTFFNNSGETNKIVVADAVRFRRMVSPSILLLQHQDPGYYGTPTTFDVIAEGTVPLFYQWAYNGTNIPNATNSFLKLPAPSALDSGTYSVIVSNEAGITSSNFYYTILPLTPMNNQALISSGLFQFMVNGDPGNYEIDTTTNLVNWT